MRRYRLLRTVALGVLLPFAGCGKANPDAAAAAVNARQDGEAAVGTRGDLSVDNRLREIAQHLRGGQYTLVSGWKEAITRCAFYPDLYLDFSAAASGSPHGMKIYQPWAKSEEAYYLANRVDQPVGQIIVKESWVPKEAAAEEAVQSFRYFARDGKYYTPDKRADLFIMFKVDPATPGTDEGWVYGIVTPDGKEVISSGHIKACADCHRQARHDRVFGEKPRPK